MTAFFGNAEITGLNFGRQYWVRTSDLYDVNVAL